MMVEPNEQFYGAPEVELVFCTILYKVIYNRPRPPFYTIVPVCSSRRRVNF